MDRRLELHAIFLALLETTSVYFQAPPNDLMVYPCIRYELDSASSKFSDNKPYNHRLRYQVTVIDEDPDSEIPLKIAYLPMCTFERFYTANNLNHYVYNIFF